MKNHKKKISPNKRFWKRMRKAGERYTRRPHPLYTESLTALYDVWKYAAGDNSFIKRIRPADIVWYSNVIIKCYRTLALQPVDQVRFLLALRRIWRFGPTNAIRKTALDTRLTYMSFNPSQK